ncbi:MAG: hypothetical protein JWR82_487 [Blastococcus sp.]|nr:hypothetical protein [Blastococcus sp.]
MVNDVHGVSSGEVVLGGVACQGWWLLVEEEDGAERIVAGPFPDRAAARWAVDVQQADAPASTAPVYGVRRADGGLSRRPSPEDWAWLAHLGEQLDRLPSDRDGALSEEDPLTTLVVEVTGALSEAGLPLHDATGVHRELGGACLTPEAALGGLVVTWRQHDRMSVDHMHGAATDAAVQQAMNHALAEVLRLRGFSVSALAGGSGHVVGLAS